jgi:hypothetical protein
MASAGVVGVTGYLKLAPHEFAANYLFDENGLAPFFAVDRQVKAGDGSQQSAFRHGDERWNGTLHYQDSNNVHPGPSLPTGTEWRLGQMREYRLQVEKVITKPRSASNCSTSTLPPLAGYGG